MNNGINIENVKNHVNLINSCEKELYNNLQSENRSMTLYLIDGEWLREYKRNIDSGALPMEEKNKCYNSFPKMDNLIIDENSDNKVFSKIGFLNEESINSFSKNVLNKNELTKVTVFYGSKKMITKVANNIYFFNYMEKCSQIKGYIKFKELNVQNNNDGIINDFFSYGPSKIFQIYVGETKPEINQVLYYAFYSFII